MSRRKKQGLARLWQLVTLLDQTRTGLTVAQLRERLEVSRSTAYRYLSDLAEANVGVETTLQTGEVRYRLLGKAVPAVVPTPRQLAALHFARAALGSWEGTDIVDQVDDLLSRWGALERGEVAHTKGGASENAAAVLRTIDGALRDRKRLALEYRGTGDAVARRRELDPLRLHEHEGKLYLFGYDHERCDFRVYKVARIAAAQGLELRVSDHPSAELDRAFEQAVKVWRGAASENVVVRLLPSVARFAREYPLVSDQTLEPLDDGSVLVRATVSGITEAMRWVLSWGKQAEAVAPQALRDAVRSEVEGAASLYAMSQPKGGLRKASERPAESERAGAEEVVAREVRRGRGRVGGKER